MAAQEDPVNDSTLKTILHECVLPITELKRHMDAFLNTPRAKQTYKELSSRIKVHLKEELEAIRREEMSKCLAEAEAQEDCNRHLQRRVVRISCLRRAPRRGQSRMQEFRPWLRKWRSWLAAPAVHN